MMHMTYIHACNRNWKNHQAVLRHPTVAYDMEQILSEIVISDSNRTKADMNLRITVVVINEYYIPFKNEMNMIVQREIREHYVIRRAQFEQMLSTFSIYWLKINLFRMQNFLNLNTCALHYMYIKPLL